MNHVPHPSEVTVIGGGPAGASIARLLATRGHVVTVLSRGVDDRRGIAESLPPSTRKVMAAVGVLDAVERSGACRNVGNAVWWGGGEGRIEDFRAPEAGSGLQIWRPDFDRLLAAEAVAAGVTWKTGNVSDVCVASDHVETTVVGRDGRAERVTSAFVVDASGRSGVLGRSSRRPIAGRRTHAWIGCWSHPASNLLAGDTRTLVETTDEGWVWSVPVSASERCVTVMVDPERTRFATAGSLERRYRGELARTTHIGPLLAGASLRRVWGCDASLYETADLGGPRHLIVGDAASFIDPLSSFGVKKALTSAWMGAAVVHTGLIDPSMAPAARELFAAREREAYGASVRASADYARQAAEHHDTAFWRERCEVPDAFRVERTSRAPVADDDIARAYAELRTRPEVALRPAADLRFEWLPAFHQGRVALERALSTGALARPIRFVDNVDLTCLVEIATRHSQVGDLFTGYCRRAAPVPLPDFLRALSVLVASRVLEPVDC
ncbi:MAG: FAD-dependent monooxygenase [Acidobacteria bacterium]|nr:FAD-dependent monooxygenase [Acidobacteriota bacterium]